MAAESAKCNACPVDLLIATRPNDVEAVPRLLEDITGDIPALTNGNDEDRKRMLVKCRALVQALETPRETMVDHCWGQVSILEPYRVMKRY
jgi:hypothetical protein